MKTTPALACTATAALLAAALAVPAEAQARTRAADPATAVKQQFKTGHGVAFTERTSIKYGGSSIVLRRRTGTFQFGPSGVTASDIATKPGLTSSQLTALGAKGRGLEPDRTIRVGTQVYLSGAYYDRYVEPEGATWVKFPGSSGEPAGRMSAIAQPISVTEPATLKTLLASGRKISGGYTGHTTLARLFTVSPWFRALIRSQEPDHSGKIQVTWKLTVNGKGLPTRLVSSYPGQTAYLGKNVKGTIVNDTSFTGWGDPVCIKAPDPATVGTAPSLDLGNT